MQGGDNTQDNGKGGESIYDGKDFADENFIHKHSKKGMVAMANNGPNSNGSQFYITFKKLSELDKKYVVFGEVISGLEVLDKIEKVGGNSKNKGKPQQTVTVYGSGVMN